MPTPAPIKSFHTDIKCINQFDGDYSKLFSTHRAVKQRCALASTHSGIILFFSKAFGTTTEDVRVLTYQI